MTADRAVLREQIARAMALVDDYDGCFERIDEWNALDQWERDAQPQEEPASDYEDAEWWRKRADAVMPLVSDALVAVEAERDAARAVIDRIERALKESGHWMAFGTVVDMQIAAYRKEHPE